MPEILRGSIRHFPVSELLTFLGRLGLSGTLDLEKASVRTRIVTGGDRIRWAESNRDRHAAEIVLDVMEWTSGMFTLSDEAGLPQGRDALAIELAPLIEEAKRRAAEALLYSDDALFRVVDQPAMPHQVSLTGDDLKLLFRLSVPRTFNELLSETNEAKKVLGERLKRLEQLGLLQPQESVESSEPETTQKTPLPQRKRTVIGSLTPDGTSRDVFPLLDPEHTIGRLEGNSITLNDGSVSSRHARIVRTEGGFVIEDLQSRNGTFVNGERVADRRTLSDGDLIRIGKVILTFNIAQESVAIAHTAPGGEAGTPRP
ncbi:MAG TPA: FHA domain-containing protein [Thermoanaerobaculia bacterium]|nr:FHA domain-containing protein [Thermoanaerobaculia bacterium]